MTRRLDAFLQWLDRAWLDATQLLAVHRFCCCL
jgi:hypothetical protein